MNNLDLIMNKLNLHPDSAGQLMKIEITDELKGRAIAGILKNYAGLSSRHINKLKNLNHIFLNSLPVYTNKVVNSGDLLTVILQGETDQVEITPQNIPLDIVYEDNSLIVLNKPPGIVIHPAGIHRDGTLANGLLFHYMGTGTGKIPVRPVSRLDRDTSGIVVFAKNPFVQQVLIKQMKDNSFVKKYVGIVHGIFDPLSGTIELPVARKPGSIIKRFVSEEGVIAVTHYITREIASSNSDHIFSIVEFTLGTGRTHQIRVHCEAKGHPIAGDDLYCGNDAKIFSCPPECECRLIKRQCLHSYSISFIHPATGEAMYFYAKLPADMKYFLEILGK